MESMLVLYQSYAQLFPVLWLGGVKCRIVQSIILLSACATTKQETRKSHQSLGNSVTDLSKKYYMESGMKSTLACRPLPASRNSIKIDIKYVLKSFVVI